MALEACELPRAWAGRSQWRLLVTGFGAGLDVLAAWEAWQADPQRPRMLQVAAILPQPPSASELLQAAHGQPGLVPLAQQLGAQWYGLVPGVHRLAFEGGQVLLTLAVGPLAAMLKELDFAADCILLSEAAAAEDSCLKAVARLCRRGTRVALPPVTTALRKDLATHGFVPDGRGARFDPAWSVKGLRDGADTAPGRCLVIGAGLAGAAAASSLARRGWQVEVLDQASEPAAGASALPAGLMAPHQSPDDNPLSRLSRSGIRITLQEAQARLAAHTDWELSGAMEQRGDDLRPLPALGPALEAWSREAGPGEAGADQGHCWWHEKAAWIKPAALVRAWLATPGVRYRGGCSVASLSFADGQWSARGDQGDVIGTASLVVVAAAHASARLLEGRIATHPVRGQVSWGRLAGTSYALPPFPFNGNGHFLPRVPLDGEFAWLSGSTYGSGDADTAPRDADHQANLGRLRVLLPAAADAMQAELGAGRVQAWTGVRCASNDRRPLLGELAPGLWVSTAMGSRGLSFAMLCAELLAARLHGEPLPLERRLAQALDAARQRP